MQIITEDKNLIVLSTMKANEAELPDDIFLRIHKSYLINLEKIDRFSSSKVEIGDFEIPLSRNKKKVLVEALKLLQNLKLTEQDTV